MADRSGWAPPGPDDEAPRSGSPEPPWSGHDDSRRDGAGTDAPAPDDAGGETNRWTPPPGWPGPGQGTPPPATGGWGQPQADPGGWTQPQADPGGWSQPQADPGGWSRPPLDQPSSPPAGPPVGSPPAGQWGAGAPGSNRWIPPADWQTPVQWGAPGAGGFQAPKPGIIPLRPLSIGEILDGAFASMRLNPAATFGLAAVVMSAVGVVNFLLSVGRNDVGPGAGIIFSLITYVVLLGAESIVAGMLSFVVSEGVLGSKVTLGEAYRKIRPRIPTLVVLGFAVLGLTSLGVIALLIGAVYIAVIFAVAGPACALEGGNVRTSLRRSRSLIKGAWWRTFGIVILVGIVTSVVGFVVEIPFAVLGIVLGGGTSIFTSSEPGVSTVLLFFFALGGIVGNTITVPLSSGAMALIYVDRRIRVEGLDVTLAQAARERAAARTGGANR